MPYKGQAAYYSVNINGTTHENLVWYYPEALPESAKVENLLAFYNEKLDIFVDGELQIRPNTYWS